MSQYSFTQLEQLWEANGGSVAAAPIAAAIALAESGGNSAALNNNPSTGDYSVGLWQINYFGSLDGPRTAQYGSPTTLQGDPNAQAKAAISVSGNGANWTPWTTYTSGAYQRYANGANSPASGPGTPGPSATDQGATAGGGQGGAPYTPSSVPGIPATPPNFPDFTANPYNELSRVLSWTTEFAGWAFFIVIVFILGVALFILGTVVMVAILAGPAVGPIAAAVGTKSPVGRAASIATSAVSSSRANADSAQLEAQRAGTSEPRSARQGNREAEEALNSSGVSRPAGADRRTRREMLVIEDRTHRGRRVAASSSGPAF